MTSEKRVLAISRQAIHNVHAREDAERETEAWRKEKANDPVSFNAGAEEHFIAWLKKKILRSQTKSIAYAWAVSNAAYELDVSVITIKRYIQKHTADRADFQTNGKHIVLRQKKGKGYAALAES